MTTETPPRKTLQDHLKALAGAALMVAFTLLLIEMLLRIVDPWGLIYFEDLATMGNELFIPDEQRGYVIQDGTYAFRYWSMAVQAGGRVVPDTNSTAACEIVILGDSVGFGYGVNDDQTWANQVAAQLPDVHLRNLAVPRYNSTNVLQTLQTYPDADAYLYLIINNDFDTAINPADQYFSGSGEGQPWLVRYMNFAIFRSGGTDRVESESINTEVMPETPQVTRFLSEVDAILARDNVWLAAFANESLTNTLLARNYPVTVLTYPAQRRISVADYHLNPQGNQELAAEIAPLFQAMQQAVCG
jgi:hypothetical protein